MQGNMPLFSDIRRGGVGLVGASPSAAQGATWCHRFLRRCDVHSSHRGSQGGYSSVWFRLAPVFQQLCIILCTRCERTRTIRFADPCSARSQGLWPPANHVCRTFSHQIISLLNCEGFSSILTYWMQGFPESSLLTESGQEPSEALWRWNVPWIIKHILNNNCMELLPIEF